MVVVKLFSLLICKISIIVLASYGGDEAYEVGNLQYLAPCVLKNVSQWDSHMVID